MSRDLAALGGVIPPLITPLSNRDEVDTESVANLVEHVLRAGCSAVFVLGTSGEATALDRGMRRTLVKVTVEAVGGRVPVLAGAIAPGTLQCIELAQDALEDGAEAIVATCPFYANTCATEIEEHFEAVHATLDGAPIFAYNIPARTAGVVLPVDVLLRLGATGRIVGVKDSGGDLYWLRRLLKDRRGASIRMSILTGSEVVADLALLLGADGIVPGLGNVDPDGFVRLCELAKAGNQNLAAAEQDRLRDLFDIVRIPSRVGRSGGAAGIGAFKSALLARGVIADDTLAPPAIQLTDDERRAVAKWTEEHLMS